MAKMLIVCHKVEGLKAMHLDLAIDSKLLLFIACTCIWLIHVFLHTWKLGGGGGVTDLLLVGQP